MDTLDISIAKSYVKRSLQGQGALQGDPGKDGKDAPTIAKIDIDENNILTTTLSDGTTLTGGTIKTIQGEKGNDGKDGISIPKGGQPGQVLVKKSETDYDTEWIDFSNSPSEGNIGDYTTIQGVLDTKPDDDIFAFVQGIL